MESGRDRSVHCPQGLGENIYTEGGVPPMADKKKVLFIVEAMGGGVLAHFNYPLIVAAPEMEVAA